jgi:hypothetical protein
METKQRFDESEAQAADQSSSHIQQDSNSSENTITDGLESKEDLDEGNFNIVLGEDGVELGLLSPHVVESLGHIIKDSCCFLINLVQRPVNGGVDLSRDGLERGPDRGQDADELEGEGLDAGRGGLASADEIVDLMQDDVGLGLQTIDDSQHVGNVLTPLEGRSRRSGGGERAERKEGGKDGEEEHRGVSK